LNDIGVCRLLAGDQAGAAAAWRQSADILGERSAARLNLNYLLRGPAVSAHVARGHGPYCVPGGPVDFASTLLSIVILEYKNPRMTLDCLRSIRAADISLPIEVILIDNSEGDPPHDFAAAELPGLRYYKAERNLGFSRGCNWGARLARGAL